MGTPPTEITPLSLHDALPIAASCRAYATGDPRTSAWTAGRWETYMASSQTASPSTGATPARERAGRTAGSRPIRSEEHTSELQSRQYLVCRLLLEKKKVLHKF